jgi:EmrB/QacA subfamily drug resistance transporter
MTTPPPLTQKEIYVVLFGALLALFLAALDQTIVATALPAIGADLGDFHLMSWIVTSYMLTATAGTPVLGKLGDMFGRRRLLLACMGLFLVASALCALSQTMLHLILARAVQGLAGGGLMTTVQALVGELVSPRERARYAAWFSLTWAMASLAGPLLGGIFAVHVGWQWVFWINLPLGLVALVVIWFALRKFPLNTRPAKVDVLSVIWLLTGSTGVLLALSEGGSTPDWGLGALLALGAGGALGLVFFLLRQRRVAEPILPPAFLSDSVIGPMLGTLFLAFGAYLAVAVLVPTYFQVGLGVGADVSGLIMIPFMLSVTLTAGLAGRYVKATGRYRLPPLIGIPVAALAILAEGLLAGHLPVWAAAALLVPVGLGIGPVFPISMLATQNAVDRKDLGAISGAVSFLRSLGGALVTAGATALLLYLIVKGLPNLAAIGGLQDLARANLTPADRAAVVESFSTLFICLSIVMLLGFLFYRKAEERPLRAA